MKDEEEAPSFEETPPTRLAEAVMAALADRDRAKRQEAIETASTWADPEELLACVGDQSDSRRRNAAMDALVRGGLRSVPVLIKALRHADPEVVMFAAGLLGKTRDASAVPHLIRLLDHAEMNVVMSSVDSLGQLRSPAAVASIARLMERDTWLRFAGIYALGEIGDDRAVDILLPLLGDSTVREMVILALGKIGSARAFPALAGLLRESENPSLFARVLCAVGRILETNPDRAAFAEMPAWIALTSPTAEEFHRSLAAALIGGGPEESERDEVKRAAAALICALELEALYADLVTAGGDPKLGKTLQFWSLSIGPGIGPALLAGLQSPEAGVRSAACRCIGSLGLRDALPRLAALLEDAEDLVRAAAVQAIADLNGVDVIGSVVRVLKDDRSLAVRDAARASLGRMDPVVVLAALLLAPPSSVDETVAVLEILAANPHPHGVAFTRACLDHPAPEVRRAAVVAAARLPGMQASGVVDTRLDDPSADVRREAVRALAPPRRLKVQQRLLYMVANDRELRDEAVRSLSRLGDPVIAARIVQILMNEAAACDASLAESVAALAQPTCEPLLMKLLSSPSADVRRIAVTALGRFGSTPALGSVAAAARDQDAAVRRAAIEALARGGQFDALERLAMDPDPGVARGARRCIEDLGRDRDTGR